MKQLVIYLTLIGIAVGGFPLQAEAGSRDEKKGRSWERHRHHHHGYYTRGYYRSHHPYRYWRYPSYYGYYRDPYDCWGYPAGPGVSFGFRLD